jgi:hypothetical protein
MAVVFSPRFRQIEPTILLNRGKNTPRHRFPSLRPLKAIIVSTILKHNARLIVSRIVLDTFRSLEMHYPELDAKRREALLAIREQLVKEGPDD